MKDRASWVLAIVLAALVVVEFLFVKHHHPVFFWHKIAGYMGFIGLVSCIVIVLASKWVGHAFLQKPEEYDER